MENFDWRYLYITLIIYMIVDLVSNYIFYTLIPKLKERSNKK